uniref:Uncharacterized protein n=1 Tax=Clostridium botulinum TaxID=1491 RepID=A0A126JHY9_CLOBO|nr:hypothetical protein [Clostridium botulinum]
MIKGYNRHTCKNRLHPGFNLQSVASSLFYGIGILISIEYII